MSELCRCSDEVPGFCPLHDDVTRVLEAQLVLEHRLAERTSRTRTEAVRINRRRKQAQGSMSKGRGAGPPGLRVVHACTRRVARSA